MLTTACCLVGGLWLGLGLGLDIQCSVWLIVVMHTYLCYFPLPLSLSHDLTSARHSIIFDDGCVINWAPPYRPSWRTRCGSAATSVVRLSRPCAKFPRKKRLKSGLHLSERLFMSHLTRKLGYRSQGQRSKSRGAAFYSG